MERRENSKSNDSMDNQLVLELQDQEQLQSTDIDRALKDTTVNINTLFDPSSGSEAPAQLYFGPGYENRLEMEVDK
jgi:hypothetical protein